MEWLQIPKSAQKEFRENLINVSVDYMQYACYKISEPLKLMYNILGFDGLIDTDNSNIQYNARLNLALMRAYTPKGTAYTLVFMYPGFEPVPILNIEIYSQDKVNMLKTEGKIVFYGAYFVFRNLIAEDAPEVLRFHNQIEISKTFKFSQKNGKEIEKPLYKRTRVDIATDVGVPMSKKWLTGYIQPHATSKHAIRPYAYDPLSEVFQSIAYIPRLTRGTGIRCYNKIEDMNRKNKKSWHPTYGTEEHPVVTRMEIIFGGDTAQDDIDTLIKYAKYRLLGDEDVKLKRQYKPQSQYSALSAYQYFEKYAKSHGKTLEQLLDDVTSIHIREEEAKRSGEDLSMNIDTSPYNFYDVF